jgi:hypothetical protein
MIHLKYFRTFDYSAWQIPVGTEFFISIIKTYLHNRFVLITPPFPEVILEC